MLLSQRAAIARETLFERYDQLNALWTAAEKQLTSLHVPRSVAHDFWNYAGHDCPNGYSQWLGLQKIKGDWRICYADHEGGGEPEDWTPIVDCSAEIRTRVTQTLPALRQAVVESAEKFIPVVEDAIAKLTDALDTSLEDLLAERAKFNGKAK